MDPLIDSIVSRLLATDADAQAFGRKRLTRLVELVELLRVERPHRDRLMSDRALADYLRVTPVMLQEILATSSGLEPVILTTREAYYRAHDVYRWLDSQSVKEAGK